MDRIGLLPVEEEVKTELESKANQKTRDAQKEYVLRMRMKEIEKELSPEDEGDEFEELERRIKQAEMPPEIEKIALKELRDLKLNSSHHIQAEVHRMYLGWLCDYPWNKQTQDNLDLINAREIFAQDHYGLEHANRRIIEFLAVRKLKPDKKGAVLCWDGPPGTGKTHLGKAIARVTGRNFIRVSLGGVRDEAEIRGHRRTYVGAMPGRIIKGMVSAGSRNPVFLLDEIDKLAADFRGDPAAALLEVLDPEVNYAFSDHYLEVPVDLSQVMFICTSNYKQNIPSTLRDRLEIIDFPGYILSEKIKIAKKFLIPKQLEENGLEKSGLEIDDSAIQTIARQYTREAGVRNLEREIATALRSRAIKIVRGEPFEKTVTSEELREILGERRFEEDEMIDADAPGVVTGLAVTQAGGGTLTIEAVKMKKNKEKSELIITGNLKDVMRESVMVSFDCAKAYLETHDIAADWSADYDFHLHCEDHEAPKDGPSAGGAIALAFISLLTGKKVRGDLAMTGEIDLLGRIMPVGGIKHKLTGAHRAGYSHVFIPKANEKDLVEVPEEVKNGLNIMLAETIDDIVKFALL